MLRRIRQAQLQMDNAACSLKRQMVIMEVCGSHTVSIFRNAIRMSIPSNIKIISGPGCPICCADDAFIDAMHSLSYRDDCIMTARAELLMVPHQQTKRTISQVENTTAVCCILDALEMARMNPDKKVIYSAVGFETCVPQAAAVIEIAIKEGISNFFILNGLKSIAPAIKKIASEINTSVDGFMCCGNLASIVGVEIYNDIINELKKPCLSVGFEPMQLIEGIAHLCKQIAEQILEPTLKYTAAGTNGNQIAKDYLKKYFDITDTNWQGLGLVKKSAYKIKNEYSDFDAAKNFEIPPYQPTNLKECKCGDVLAGLIDPPDCPLFRNECTRKSPIGSCMAVQEGPCNVWDKYTRKRKLQ